MLRRRSSQAPRPAFSCPVLGTVKGNLSRNPQAAGLASRCRIAARASLGVRKTRVANVLSAVLSMIRVSPCRAMAPTWNSMSASPLEDHYSVYLRAKALAETHAPGCTVSPEGD